MRSGNGVSDGVGLGRRVGKGSRTGPGGEEGFPGRGVEGRRSHAVSDDARPGDGAGGGRLPQQR